MGFQTKIIVSFLSMLGCVSVMTTGVVAILYQNDMQFVNNETIQMREVSGDLYVMRFGAGYEDVWDEENSTKEHPQPVLLVTEGNRVVDQSLLNRFLQNVTFSPETKNLQSRKIEYVFKYEISTLTEVPTLISIKDAKVNKINSITREDLGVESDLYEATYRYAYSEQEPKEWDETDSLEFPLSTEFEPQYIQVNRETNIIWIRACLQVKAGIVSGDATQTTTTGIDTEYTRTLSATNWSYKLIFESAGA